MRTYTACGQGTCEPSAAPEARRGRGRSRARSQPRMRMRARRGWHCREPPARPASLVWSARGLLRFWSLFRCVRIGYSWGKCEHPAVESERRDGSDCLAAQRRGSRQPPTTWQRPHERRAGAMRCAVWIDRQRLPQPEGSPFHVPNVPSSRLLLKILSRRDVYGCPGPGTRRRGRGCTVCHSGCSWTRHYRDGPILSTGGGRTGSMPEPVRGRYAWPHRRCLRSFRLHQLAATTLSHRIRRWRRYGQSETSSVKRSSRRIAMSRRTLDAMRSLQADLVTIQTQRQEALDSGSNESS